MRQLTRYVLFASVSLAVASAATAQEVRRITVLYDAFGQPSKAEMDWGFAALIEYGNRRILFDTGNDAGIFERNVKTLGVDLGRLDAAVISHRHGDHTTGLGYLVKVNPAVTIYTPEEGGYFKSTAPNTFLQPYPGLPPELRYYSGQAAPRWVSGSPWEGARFETVTKTTEILPGFFVLTTRSAKPGTVDMNEVSLAIRTPRGLAVIVGCSHPGVEHILAEAARIDARIYTVTGGFHLVMTPEDEVRRVASILHDERRIERVAPGHCTSELGFAVFLEQFKDRFDRAGLGAVLSLP